MVKVEVVDTGGRYFIGTGTVVRPGRVATACHVTRSARRIDVLQGGLRHAVEWQRADSEHDVCLLRVPALESVAASVGRSDSLSAGDPVIAIGFTGGVSLAPAIGAVERLYRHDGARVILTDAGFSSGASGGGLFDVEGRLVGLLMFRMRGPGAQFFAVPAEWFAALADSDDHYRPVAPLVGPEAFWHRSPESLPWFMRAHSMESDDRWEELRVLAAQWHAARPEDADALHLLGRLDQRREDRLAAIEHYRAAVAADPHHGSAWFDLGMTYLQAGRRLEAQAVVAPLLAASPILGRRLIDALPARYE